MRRVATGLVLAVLAASGVYALVYLFRWEWHRAIITALFFVAAEIGLGLAVLLRRIVRIEARLEDLAGQPPPDALHAVEPDVLARLRDSAPPPSKPFAWLDPSRSELSVFLPFLLGVGALASGLAWVVEQVARRTTTPALERRLARRLVPLALPAGGLLGSDPPAPTRVDRRGLVPSWTLPMTGLFVVVALTGAGLDWLGDALQTRPDARRAEVSTSIDLELRGVRAAARPAQSAAILWGTCSHVLHGTVGQAEVLDRGEGHVQVLVPTDIGTHAEERLRGCLQDLVVDRVRATVRSVESVPSR